MTNPQLKMNRAKPTDKEVKALNMSGRFCWMRDSGGKILQEKQKRKKKSSSLADNTELSLVWKWSWNPPVIF